MLKIFYFFVHTSLDIVLGFIQLTYYYYHSNICIWITTYILFENHELMTLNILLFSMFYQTLKATKMNICFSANVNSCKIWAIKLINEHVCEFIIFLG